PEREIIGEKMFLVGDQDDVVVLGFLEERRNLLLNLLIAAIGATAAGVLVELKLLDDLATELFGGPPIGIREKLIFGGRPIDEQPVPPLLPSEVLRERVGQHRARRRDVKDVGTAILLAQPVVRVADVEDERGL